MRETLTEREKEKERERERDGEITIPSIWQNFISLQKFQFPWYSSNNFNREGFKY
jgi:hypothetical protein